MHEITDGFGLYGHMATEITCNDIAIAIGNVIHNKLQCRREVLDSCIHSLAGKTVTYSLLNQLFGRIASCGDRLARDKPVFVEDNFVPPESWHLLHVDNAEEVSGQDIVNIKLSLSVAWGHLFGFKLTRLLASNDLGLLRLLSDLVPHGRGKKLSADWNEMTQMLFWGELLNNGMGIVFRRFYVDEQADTINMKVRRLRQKPCPRRYNWPCSHCPAGYDVCPAGCRPESITPLPEPPNVLIDQSPGTGSSGPEDLDESWP